jgi:hypothetical protein
VYRRTDARLSPGHLISHDFDRESQLRTDLGWNADFGFQAWSEDWGPSTPSAWQNSNASLFRVRAETGQLELFLDGVPSPNALVLNTAEKGAVPGNDPCKRALALSLVG